MALVGRSARLPLLVLLPVRQDPFAAVRGYDVDRGWQLQDGAVRVVWVFPEEDALGAAPSGGDLLAAVEDFGGVGEEGAVPEVGGASFDEVKVVALEVEAEGGAGFVLAVEDDAVFGFELRGDGAGESLRGKGGREEDEASPGGEQEEEGSGGEREGGGLRVIAAAEEEVGERAASEGYGGEQQGEAEEAEGAGVEVEEVAEGEGVVAGVLDEEGGEVGAGKCGPGCGRGRSGRRPRRGDRG